LFISNNSSVDLAFWSSIEQFTKNDIALIQYKNISGECVTLLSILDKENNIPTNKTMVKTLILL